MESTLEAPEVAEVTEQPDFGLTLPLTGQALLNRLSALRSEGVKERDAAIECGYFTRITDKETGEQTIRASVPQFRLAQLEAAGLALPSSGSAPTSNSSQAVANANGSVILGLRFTKKLKTASGEFGVEPGTVFDVTALEDEETGEVVGYELILNREASVSSIQRFAAKPPRKAKEEAEEGAAPKAKGKAAKA